MNFTDTIAAVATGNMISAIGIVRISGEKALCAAESIFSTMSGTPLKDARDRQMYYGSLKNKHGELIDLCLCMVSRSPETYTGEDTVEFHCHGSPAVLSELLDTLFALGVRQAKAGEFTKRAFLNGRMDLTQAEAVIDLIEAETPFAIKNAASQLQGAVCSKMNEIYERLVGIVAHFHAVIDYPDEDIDEFTLRDYLTHLREGEDNLRRLLDTHERGKVLRTGIPTAIIGRTNTGKSTLLNALLGFERAIVTDIPGTTRDTVEEKVLIGNVLLRLIDTAGLRETDDTVEKLGLERTHAALERAELVLVVLDGSEPLQEDDYKALESIPDATPAIVIVNKSDLPPVIDDEELLRHCEERSDEAIQSKNSKCIHLNRHASLAMTVGTPKGPIICISAKTGEGLDRLTAEIQKLFPDFAGSPAGEVITNRRQAEAIGKAIQSIKSAKEAMTDGVSPDAVLTDIEGALAAIGEVTGKTVRNDIISRIFERFCVGK